MDSLIWDNSSVEIMKMQHHTISVCMNAIFDKLVDNSQSCAHVDGLLDQLELLCQKQFEYDEQLLEEVNCPSVAEQKRLHDLYLKGLNLLKAENGQCHAPSFITNFIKLRIDYVLNMNKETMLLCDSVLKV